MSGRRHVSTADTATLQQIALPAAGYGSLALVLLTDPVGQARAIRLARPLTLGRGPACDLSLDEAASRLHARLVPAQDRIEVVDLGSHNGTFLDGRRIRQGSAVPGSILRTGESVGRIVALTEEWQCARAEGPLVGGTSLAGARRLLSLCGPTELAVLIQGETGTGKEVAARVLHGASGRRGPFLAVNCAALPESLVESELFGHVRGAFTGADRGRKGLFTAASGGTLFLDEVGDIPTSAQAKLLRVLEDGLVRAVGTEAAHKVDVRVVSATNRDLRDAVAQGRFRADLLARLAAVELHMPPLRSRPEDLPALCQVLLARSGRGPRELTANALEAMALYDWPQNVRELDNVLRAATLTSDGPVTFEGLPERVQTSLRAARETAETESRRPAEAGRERVIEALREHHGNMRRASQALGIARSHLYRLIDRFSLDVAQFRRATDDGTGVA